MAKARLTGLITIICLLATIAAPALAATGIFTDVSAGHWAEKDIALMKAKGVVAGTDLITNRYSPNDPVTREQLVVMLLRSMDMEKNAAGKQVPAALKNPEKISSWFVSSVAYAVEKGIIAGQDLESFRPGEGAKRYEVAVFVTRALGLEAEATTLAGSVLPYTDALDIPVWARGYVAVMRTRQIISGNADGSYKPLENLTRAQMAVILARVDAQARRLMAAETGGTVFSVSPADRSLILTLPNGTTVTAPIASNGLIYKNGQPVELTQLQRYDKVVGVPDVAGRYVYLEVLQLGQDFAAKVKGVIKSVSGVASVVVTRDAGGETTFSLDTGTLVYAGDQHQATGYLAAGQEVEIIAVGTRAVRIDILSVEQRVKGTLKSLNTSGERPVLTMTLDSGSEATYTLVPTTSILLDSKQAATQELYPGQKVDVTVRGTVAVLVLAASIDWDLSGTLVSVAFAPSEVVRVELQDGQVADFPVSVNVRVRRQGSLSTLRDILAGDSVDLTFKNGTVTSIYASPVESEVKGRVQSVTLAANPRVTIVLADGTEKTYTLATGARIRRGSLTIQPAAIQINSLATLKLNGSLVTNMNVEVRTLVEYVIGTIENINTTARVLVIREISSNDLREVYLKSSAEFLKFEDSVSFSRLKIGDEVIAVGKMESGVFMSTLVVVVGSSES